MQDFRYLPEVVQGHIASRGLEHAVLVQRYVEPQTPLILPKVTGGLDDCPRFVLGERLEEVPLDFPRFAVGVEGALLLEIYAPEDVDVPLEAEVLVDVVLDVVEPGLEEVHAHEDDVHHPLWHRCPLPELVEGVLHGVGEPRHALESHHR